MYLLSLPRQQSIRQLKKPASLTYTQPQTSPCTYNHYTYFKQTFSYTFTLTNIQLTQCHILTHTHTHILHATSQELS